MKKWREEANWCVGKGRKYRWREKYFEDMTKEEKSELGKKKGEEREQRGKEIFLNVEKRKRIWKG